MSETLIRFFSAVIAIPLALGSLTYSYQSQILFWIVVGLTCAWEIYNVIGRQKSFIAHLALHILAIISVTRNSDPIWFGMSYFFHFILFIFSGGNLFEEIKVQVLIKAWITYPIIIGIHYTTTQNPIIIGLLNIVWFNDAGAYFAGKLFGRTLLAPIYSPKKTIEGTLGGVLVGVFVGMVTSQFSSTLDFNTWIIVALIASITGQIGDIFESAFKRSFNVKDSGGIMPGHGGFLDRFDGVFFAIVFVDFYLRK